MANKIAIVTGASGGIGTEAAAFLRNSGCTVYDLSRSNNPQDGIKHIRCDVTDEESVKSAVDTVIKESGRVDILVNCAGMGISGAVEFTKPEDSFRQMDVNLFGTDRVVRAVLPVMRKQRTGRLVMTGSVAGMTPIPFQAWYSASKAAIISYSMALMNEVRPYGISVAVINPGDIKTGFTAARKKSVQGNGEYSGRIERSVRKMEKDEQNGLPASYAGMIVAKAALKKSPKPICSTGFIYGFLCTLVKVLPTRVSQWVLYRMYAR
ncbi:MAG: SDR family NAD(P)-dependent oxidoreductase [Clostridiales bacterium]|nr:SDR family NAD(P)-dependent oxidoreductase [Clostridiales bacterium]